MKGIKCCGECAYYNMKKHKCMGGAKDPGKAEDNFYNDCPHVDAELLKYGQWIQTQLKGYYECSVCKCEHTSNPNQRFCSYCGARMSTTDTDVSKKEEMAEMSARKKRKQYIGNTCETCQFYNVFFHRRSSRRLEQED